jgi:hypothetical protein
MAMNKKIEPDQLAKTPAKMNEKGDIAKGSSNEFNLTINARLEELESMPHRNAVLHWAAFVFALMSLILLSAWVFSSRGLVPFNWILLDIGLGIAFAIEFFTRSEFRWKHFKYMRTHFFDFIALVPALALVNQGFIIEGVWLWLVLIARATRVVDRLLGDGFVRRNVLALVEGFEEELTDRVLERIITRVQADMDRACFSQAIATALSRNKPALLQRVRAATPNQGFVPGVARIVGLDKALEHAEENTYDAIVGIMNSNEVDNAIRDVINSAFSRMHSELGTRSWRKHLGIKRRKIIEPTDAQALDQEA